LKTVAGLSTAQIARSFLVSEATMGQRLLRTRNKIAHTGIRLQVPEPPRLAERTAGVLAVIYLIFTEGYGAPESEAAVDLATEAIRLAELLTRLLPHEAEAHGLYALLLLQHARRLARTTREGDLIPMEEQDRSRWDQDMITAGLSALNVARATADQPGPYLLQAEIAAIHIAAPAAAATDWTAVIAGYDALLRLQPSPVIALNRALAVGLRDGPTAGLDLLEQLDRDPRLSSYHLLPAAQADLLRRAGRREEAAAAYRRALTLVGAAGERRFLQNRLHEVLSEPDTS
jgi:RNA polymerase sigma-70 factor (ECF subfamily)